MRITANRMFSMMAAATLITGVLFPLIGGVTGQIRSFGAVMLLLILAVAYRRDAAARPSSISRRRGA